jgi:hypothetical protein
LRFGKTHQAPQRIERDRRSIAQRAAERHRIYDELDALGRHQSSRQTL